MRNVNCALFFLLSLSISGFAQSPFWYAGDERVNLYIDSTRINVRFDAGISFEQAAAELAKVDDIAAVLREEQLAPEVLPCLIRDKEHYATLVEALRQMESVFQVEPYYLSAKGNSRVMTGGVFVRFDPAVSLSEIESINATLKTAVGYKIHGIPNAYRIERTKSCQIGDVDLANTYHTMRETVYAHPDFAIPIVLHSYKLYDYYHAYQWHIKKITGDFNNASVWDFAGLDDSIIVAVIDDGVAPHEDLDSTRLVMGYNFVHGYEGGLPYWCRFHGQACAGLIAASHCTDSAEGQQNSSGIISIAPNVYIMPLVIVRDNDLADPASKFADAVGYAWENGADVISNSWGIKPEYWDDPPPPGLSNAFYCAATYGRDELGCPIIFAAGNEGETCDTVPYPANHYTNFVVGAVRQDDSLWSYSNYDPNDHMVDLVAPSGGSGIDADVWTLDQMDTLGANRTYPPKRAYSPNQAPHDDDTIIYDCPPDSNDLDYNCKFSGTSASCPMVAGVAALLLSRDPTLPRSRQLLGGGGVYEILRGSAVTHLDWGNISPPDYAYGYGRIDAYRAVLSIARGDANNDGEVTLGDAMYLVSYLFVTGPPPWPDSLLGDISCDGQITLGDIMILIDHLNISQAPLPLPCFEFND